jgi:hypothetical protein
MKKDKLTFQASISTWVMLMFGMSVICYMMGFTNLWTMWSSNPAAISQGVKSAGISSTALFDNPWVLYGIMIGALSAIVITYALVTRYLGGGQVLAYIIPLVFLVIFLNIFVFPIGTLSAELQFAGSYIPIAAFMVAFFNLFLILSIVEFIRSGTT